MVGTAGTAAVAATMVAATATDTAATAVQGVDVSFHTFYSLIAPMSQYKLPASTSASCRVMWAVIQTA